MSNSAVKKSHNHQVHRVRQQEQTGLLNDQKQQKQKAIFKIKQLINNQKQKKSYQNIFVPSQQSSPTLMSNNRSPQHVMHSTLPLQSTKNRTKMQKQMSQIKNTDNSLNNQKSINQKPLFKRFAKEQEFIQPQIQVNYNVNANKNSLKTIPNLSNFNKFEINNNQVPSNFKSMFHNDKTTQSFYQKSHNSKKDLQNDSFIKLQQVNDDEFGQGLQQITKRQNKVDEQENNLFKNTYSSNRNQKENPTSLISTFPQTYKSNLKDNSQFKPQSTGFSPQPSKISMNKKRIDRRINQVQKRESSKNFYKRAFSSSYSHQFINSHSHDKQNGKKQFKKKQSLNISNNGSLKGGNENNLAINKEENLRRPSINNNLSPTLKNLKQNEVKQKSAYRPTIHNHNQITNAQFDILQLGLNQIYDTFQYITKQKAKLNLNIANNLNRLLFRYNGGHAATLYNYALKIKNQSPISIHMKIKCTSPAHYIIRPSTSVILPPSQIVNFSIQLKLYAHDLNPLTMKHQLSRYKKDKIKICYQASQIHPDMDYEQGQIILPVIIQQTHEQKIRNQGMIQNMKNQEQKIAIEQKQIKAYKSFIQKNNIQIDELDKKIKLLDKKQFYLDYFNKSLFTMVIIIGILLGFWVG